MQMLSNLIVPDRSVTLKIEIFKIISNRIHEGLKLLLRVKVRNEIIKI